MGSLAADALAELEDFVVKVLNVDAFRGDELVSAPAYPGSYASVHVISSKTRILTRLGVHLYRPRVYGMIGGFFGRDTEGHLVNLTRSLVVWPEHTELER